MSYWQFFPPWRKSPWWARASSLSRLHDHTQTHHTRQDFYVRVISPTQRPLPDNTQQSQETGIHTSGGIRTRNPNKQAAADPVLDGAATGIIFCMNANKVTTLRQISFFFSWFWNHMAGCAAEIYGPHFVHPSCKETTQPVPYFIQCQQFSVSCHVVA
jgi:hypothetical protein